jgi:3'(2'), 5'-bisphosphate nucleotidase
LKKPENMLEALLNIVEAASENVRALYECSEIEARRKADMSPVTLADLTAEKTIREGLQSLGTIPIISEEADFPSFDERKNWRRVWLVDPLDGTREFIARNGEFTVNVALIDDGHPVLGVVGVPALRTTYWAAQGAGAFVQRDRGSPTRISTRVACDLPVVVVSRSHPSEGLAMFLKHFGLHRLVYAGSSLKCCLVAEGTAQIYPRLGTTYEWDTAAAHCIVEQAGGYFGDFQGHPLIYNKPNLKNAYFFASSPSVRAQILAWAPDFPM